MVGKQSGAGVGARGYGATGASGGVIGREAAGTGAR